MIFKFFKWLFSLMKKHPKGIIAGAAGIGAAGGGAGLFAARKAKKTNKKALKIKQDALDKYDSENKKTEKKLVELGKTEKTIIDSFSHFSDLMEQIQGRPKFKTNIFSEVKLPNIELSEIKIQSKELQMAFAGIGGVGAGALAGLAAFGATTIIAAPVCIGAGAALCVKGFSLRKKATENVKQAKQLSKRVDEIVNYFEDLRQAADSFNDCLQAVFARYREYVERVEITLLRETEWKKLTSEEKKEIENTVLLTRLLYSMVQTNIIIQQENEDKIESVNNKGILTLKKKADKMLDKTK